MRVFINKNDVSKVQEKYGQENAVATFTQSTAPSNQRQLAEMFIIVSNPQTFETVKLNRKLEEISHESIAKDEIENLKISGMINKKVTFTVKHQDYRFWFKPIVIGSGKEQKEMIKEFENC